MDTHLGASPHVNGCERLVSASSIHCCPVGTLLPSALQLSLLTSERKEDCALVFILNSVRHFTWKMNVLPTNRDPVDRFVDAQIKLQKCLLL